MLSQLVMLKVLSCFYRALVQIQIATLTGYTNPQSDRNPAAHKRANEDWHSQRAPTCASLSVLESYISVFSSPMSRE